MTDPLKKAAEWLEELQRNKVINDVIPYSTAFGPEVFFSVVWEDNDIEVPKPGLTLDRGLTVKQPKIKIHPLFNPAGDFTYTLVVTDPDAPSREDPKFREFRHWVVSIGLTLSFSVDYNRFPVKVSGLKLPTVHASDVLGTYVTTSGNTITPWYPPEPPAGSGPHRYGAGSRIQFLFQTTYMTIDLVFLLFREPADGVDIPKDAIERKADASARQKWKAIEFGDKYNMKLSGATFFFTEIRK